MAELIAYHNDASLKSFVIDTLERHKAADKIVHGTYWQDGKGCAVGAINQVNDVSAKLKKALE